MKTKFLFLVLTLSTLFFSSLQAKRKQCDLAVCAIFQNEAPYLKEWIEFHKLMGVKKFYLYNNFSTDDYKKVLRPYIKAKEVEVIKWKYKSTVDFPIHVQSKAYTHALKRAKKKKIKWMAFLDSDEFLFPVEKNSLTELLEDYNDLGIGALTANWQMYGTSNIGKIPADALLIEHLIMKAPTETFENTHIKSIVRVAHATHFVNPHYANFKPGYHQVNSNKIPFEGPFTPVVVDKIRINHYWTRDEDFLHNVKNARRKMVHDNSCLEHAATLNVEVDTSIHRFLAPLKIEMQKVESRRKR